MPSDPSKPKGSRPYRKGEKHKPHNPCINKGKICLLMTEDCHSYCKKWALYAKKMRDWQIWKVKYAKKVEKVESFTRPCKRFVNRHKNDEKI